MKMQRFYNESKTLMGYDSLSNKGKIKFWLIFPFVYMWHLYNVIKFKYEVKYG